MNYHYYNRYLKLIEVWKTQVIPDLFYVEKHHINPVSLGGSDDPENIITLTFRQHYLAHYLLMKAYKNKEMYAALSMMMPNRRGRRFLNSRQYEICRNAASEARKLWWADPENRASMSGENNPNYGTTWSEETILRNSESNKRRWRDPEYRKSREGITMSNESKLKSSKSNKLKWRDPEYRAKHTGINHHCADQIVYRLFNIETCESVVGHLNYLRKNSRSLLDLSDTSVSNIRNRPGRIVNGWQCDNL